MASLKRFPLFLLLPPVLGLSLLVGFRMHHQEDFTARTPFAPFMVHQQKLYFPKQQDIPPAVGDRVFAIKANGSMALRLRELEGDSGGVTAVLDRSNGYVLDIDHDTRSVSSLQTTATTFAEWLSSLHPGCATLEKRGQGIPDGPRELLGIPVKGLREKLKDGTYERLVAPEIDCFPLREIFFFSNGARNETSTTSVKIGGPDEALFAVPSDYVERSPVEVETLYEQKHGGRQKWPPKVLEDVQARYLRLRKQR